MEFKGREVQELKEQVVFRSYDNKRQQPVVLCPLQDETGKIWTGQGEDGYLESLSENDKKAMAFVITGATYIRVTDGKVLKPDNKIDKENWRWIQFHPYVALDRAKGKSSRDAVYYVENRTLEAGKRVEEAKAKDKARYLIQYEMSESDMVNVARIIGHPAPEGFKPIELKDYLLMQADVVAPAILSAANPKNAVLNGVKITFNELVRWKIIEKFKGGSYRFGGEKGTHLGHTEELVANWLANPDNIETVAAMTDLLADKKNTTKV